jgi:hypothetical protein
VVTRTKLNTAMADTVCASPGDRDVEDHPSDGDRDDADPRRSAVWGESAIAVQWALVPLPRVITGRCPRRRG